MNGAYRQIALLLTAGILASCHPPEEKRYYPTGQLHSRVPLDEEGLYNGYCLTFSPDGTLLAKIPYQHGVKEGLLYLYYPTGELHGKQTFRQNKRNGLTQYFYANGKTKTIKHYRNDVLVGTSVDYYPSDSLQARVWYGQNGKVLDLDYFKPSGSRDRSWTEPLVVAACDTISEPQAYAFDVVLANALSNAVTVRITSPGNTIDSLPAPMGKHRYIVSHPRPGVNQLRGRVYNKVLGHDTLYTYWYELRHTFWVRPAKVTE